MKKIRSSRYDSSYVVSMLAAVSMAAAGFIGTLPFFYFLFFSEPSQYISTGKLISMIIFLIALPMFLLGLVSIFTRKGQSYSTLENDVSRIRFAAETHMMHDIMKGHKND